jgi:DNA-binding transcriptional ArsR family regulator
MKVELDKQALFALASDTRLDILRSLQSNRRTVSQLADLLNIDKAGVHRHLRKLEEGGLVTRTEDHGFVYYALSRKARDVISPGENTRIVLLLACSIICLVGMVAVLYIGTAPMDRPLASEDVGQMPANELPSGQGAWEWAVAAVLLAAAAAGLAGVAARRMWVPRQRGGEETPDPATGRGDRTAKHN